MNTSETQSPQRVARPKPGDERGWLGLVLDLIPLPAIVVDTGSGGVVVRNRVAGRELSAISGETETTGPNLFQLAASATGEDGRVVTWPTATGEAVFRVFARILPPADGLAPLALLTFLPTEADHEAAEHQLREAIETRDEFFSVATHELKDPLFSIQLSLQLLQHAAEKQGPVPAHVAHHLDVAGRQANRLSRLIDNLLDISRIRSGRLQLDPEAIDLSELAREAAGRFGETAHATGTSLTAETTGEVVGYFDRLKLDQVLSNLLTNALKYGAGRPVIVRVREEGQSAVLEVEDHGPGVADTDRERIFARFERASDGHKKESLGLGLYIVRSIAEAHGGTATVRSEPGRGATFVITLPRNRLHNKTTGPAPTEPRG